MTVFGSGFDEPVAVGFAGVAAAIISVSGSEIVARTGAVVVDSCQDVVGESQVVNIETSDGATGPDFTYRVFEPVVSSISPTELPEGGGTVTLTDTDEDEWGFADADDCRAILAADTLESAAASAATFYACWEDQEDFLPAERLREMARADR